MAELIKGTSILLKLTPDDSIAIISEWPAKRAVTKTQHSGKTQFARCGREPA